MNQTITIINHKKLNTQFSLLNLLTIMNSYEKHPKYWKKRKIKSVFKKQNNNDYFKKLFFKYSEKNNIKMAVNLALEDLQILGNKKFIEIVKKKHFVFKEMAQVARGIYTTVCLNEELLCFKNFIILMTHDNIGWYIFTNTILDKMYDKFTNFMSAYVMLDSFYAQIKIPLQYTYSMDFNISYLLDTKLLNIFLKFQALSDEDKLLVAQALFSLGNQSIKKTTEVLQMYENTTLDINVFKQIIVSLK